MLAVIAGAMVATWTMLPLLTPSTVTLASRAVPAVKLLSPLTLTVRLVNWRWSRSRSRRCRR